MALRPVVGPWPFRSLSSKLLSSLPPPSSSLSGATLELPSNSVLPSVSRLSHRHSSPRNILPLLSVESSVLTTWSVTSSGGRMLEWHMPTQFVDLFITSHSLGLGGSGYFRGDFPFKRVDHIDSFLGEDSIFHYRIGHSCGQGFSESLQVDSRVVTFQYATNACFQVLFSSCSIKCPTILSTSSGWCKINQTAVQWLAFLRVWEGLGTSPGR